MEESKTLLCSLKLPLARERISWKFIDKLGTRSQNVSPALLYNLIFSINVLSKNLPCIFGDRIQQLQEGPCSLVIKYLGKRKSYFITMQHCWKILTSSRLSQAIHLMGRRAFVSLT